MSDDFESLWRHLSTPREKKDQPKPAGWKSADARVNRCKPRICRSCGLLWETDQIRQNGNYYRICHECRPLRYRKKIEVVEKFI